MKSEEACPRIEALSALTDGELGEPQRLALEAHVAACALCAPALADLRHLRACFAALPEPEFDFDVAAEVDRRISPVHEPRRARPRARARWWQIALLAPGGAAAVTVGLWLGASVMPATLSSVPAPAAQMAAFSALPPGALCPAGSACGGFPR